MTARFHVHLHVRDLSRSAAFYERFFGTAPDKRMDDYARFSPDDAPVLLALTGGATAEDPQGPVDHLGFSLESPGAVTRWLERIQGAGVAHRTEIGVDCCYANSDKFWVTDPDGIQWEVYHLNHDLLERGQPSTLAPRPDQAPCCTPAPEAGPSCC